MKSNRKIVPSEDKTYNIYRVRYRMGLVKSIKFIQQCDGFQYAADEYRIEVEAEKRRCDRIGAPSDKADRIMLYDGKNWIMRAGTMGDWIKKPDPVKSLLSITEGDDEE